MKDGPMKSSLTKALHGFAFIVGVVLTIAPAMANSKAAGRYMAASGAPMNATLATTSATLSAEDTPAQIENALNTALIGRTRAEVIPTLQSLGARGVATHDFQETEFAKGTDLGDGYRAGDPLLTAIFGLARSGIQPDRRLRIYLQYEEGNQPEQQKRIQKLVRVEYYAK